MNKFFSKIALNRTRSASPAARCRSLPLRKILSAGLLLGVSAGASAHPGHSDGFLAAFAHPFTGVDHLLMMLFVGVWAGRSGGTTRWLLPATFLSSMLGGWSLGANGLIIPGLESGIAATLIVLGVLLVLQVQLPRAAQIVLVALFALLHGLAHGGELQAAWPSAVGMVLATALLHGLGLTATALIPARHGVIYRVAGAGLALVGGGLLATI
ncbi:MAG TPA: HupE/UreJ family protein [Spongiibacteraceae bacterium]|nr:HupE/UreJ family protein [Spongiibacteraceae bacterium]